jgi:hypothetical protein
LSRCLPRQVGESYEANRHHDADDRDPPVNERPPVRSPVPSEPDSRPCPDPRW